MLPEMSSPTVPRILRLFICGWSACAMAISPVSAIAQPNSSSSSSPPSAGTNATQQGKANSPPNQKTPESKKTTARSESQGPHDSTVEPPEHPYQAEIPQEKVPPNQVQPQQAAPAVPPGQPATPPSATNQPGQPQPGQPQAFPLQTTNPLQHTIDGSNSSSTTSDPTTTTSRQPPATTNNVHRTSPPAQHDVDSIPQSTNSASISDSSPTNGTGATLAAGPPKGLANIPPKTDTLTPLQTAGWWTLFGAIAVATAGGVFVGLIDTKEGQISRIAKNTDATSGGSAPIFAAKMDRYDELVRQGQSYEKTAHALLITGGLAAAASLTLFIIDSKRNKPRSTHAHRSLFEVRF